MVYLTDEEEYLFHSNRYCSELETREQLTSNWTRQEQKDGFSVTCFFSLKPFPKGRISLCMKTESNDEKQGKPQFCRW